MVFPLWQHLTLSALLIPSFVVCSPPRGDVRPQASHRVKNDILFTPNSKSHLRKNPDSVFVGPEADSPLPSTLHSGEVFDVDSDHFVLLALEEEERVEQKEEQKDFLSVDDRLEMVKREEVNESDANQGRTPGNSNSGKRRAKKLRGKLPRFAAYSNRLPVKSSSVDADVESSSAIGTNPTDTEPTSPFPLPSTDVDPAEELAREKSYNTLVGNNLELRNKLCPVCIAAVPLFVKGIRGDQTTEIGAFLSGNAFNRYDFSDIVMNLELVHTLFYANDVQLMIEQSNEICSVVILEMLLKRIERQMINTRSAVKRGNFGHKNAANSKRRLAVQEYLFEDMKTNPESLSCHHAGFAEEANRWEREFDDLLSDD